MRLHSRSKARPLLAAALVAAWAPAAAGPSPEKEGGEPQAELTPDDVGLWAWLLDPHAREIEVVLNKARQNIQQAVKTYQVPDSSGRYSEANAENRRRLLEDAIGMLRYGMRLDPDNVQLELELGKAADENGRPEVARRALESYLADELPERIQAEARWRLGRLYARQGRWKEAVVQLRLALGAPQSALGERTQIYVALATVYMELGRVAESIDLLRHSIGQVNASPYGNHYALRFALAVAYDRDEQITLAHESLNKIMAGNQRQNLLHVLYDQRSNSRIRFAPSIDRHYFTALQLEAMGHLIEARREWRAYAAHEDARYRERALEHVAAIDRMMAKKRTDRGSE